MLYFYFLHRQMVLDNCPDNRIIYSIIGMNQLITNGNDLARMSQHKLIFLLSEFTNCFTNNTKLPFYRTFGFKIFLVGKEIVVTFRKYLYQVNSL